MTFVDAGMGMGGGVCVFVSVCVFGLGRPSRTILVQKEASEFKFFKILEKMFLKKFT